MQPGIVVLSLHRRHASIVPQGSGIDKKCELEINAREHLELPTRLIKRYIKKNPVTLYYICGDVSGNL